MLQLLSGEFALSSRSTGGTDHRSCCCNFQHNYLLLSPFRESVLLRVNELIRRLLGLFLVWTDILSTRLQTVFQFCWKMQPVEKWKVELTRLKAQCENEENEVQLLAFSWDMHHSYLNWEYFLIQFFLIWIWIKVANTMQIWKLNVNVSRIRYDISF